MDWHPTKRLLATCSRDKSIWIWEYDEDLEFQCHEVLNGHSQDVKMVKWVPGADYQLVSASYDDTIKLWEAEDDEWICKQTLSEHSSTVWSIAFAFKGKYMITGSEDTSVKVFTKLPSGDKYAFSLNISGYHERTVYSVDASPIDPRIIASAGGDDSLCLYLLKEPQTSDDNLSFDLIENRPLAHSADLNCVKFHPKLRLIATCSDDCEIKLWTY